MSGSAGPTVGGKSADRNAAGSPRALHWDSGSGRPRPAIPPDLTSRRTGGRWLGLRQRDDRRTWAATSLITVLGRWGTYGIRHRVDLPWGRAEPRDRSRPLVVTYESPPAARSRRFSLHLVPGGERPATLSYLKPRLEERRCFLRRREGDVVRCYGRKPPLPRRPGPNSRPPILDPPLRSATTPM